MDFSGSVDLDKIMMLMEVEMQMINPGDDVIIVGAQKQPVIYKEGNTA